MEVYIINDYACVCVCVCHQRIQSAANEDWEPKRVERPKGVPEWGVAPSEPSTPPRNAEINRR